MSKSALANDLMDQPELMELPTVEESDKLLELYQSIEFLKQELDSKIVSELKQCNTSLKKAIGDLNNAIKKSK